MADPVAGVQRERILQTALELMAEGGLNGTSMRKLAAACELNVATLYHYFPSKHELFAAAVAHQRVDLLVAEPPPPDLSRPVPERIGALLSWLLGELPERGEHIWRLLLGESLRGEPLVVEQAAELSDAFNDALVGWIAACAPDDSIDVHAAARVLRSAIYGCIVESLLDPDRWDHLATQRGADLAALLTR